jgi:hypothetical protein
MTTKSNVVFLMESWTREGLLGKNEDKMEKICILVTDEVSILAICKM